MPARIPSWAWVGGLTAAAVVAVGTLAAQADQGAHPVADSARPSASAPAGRHSPAAPPKHTAPPAPPSDSGTGRRVVYSLGHKRVWLMDVRGMPTRTFAVWPGTVSPDPGAYAISQRVADPTKGSDGVEIEHIMYFAGKSGVFVAFSNAVDGSSPPPVAEGIKTGGVRTGKQDGAALWAFAEKGTRVVVVP
ncbi:hypothetical protein [Streptomyces sp. NRRL S-340]|uniref:hypothetical protein n=1 Tax=Streptomyces sp. NRRL S-340 TaxID=1463901 RepID=UPI0005623EF9|nr:hypothetical protein [Streptomyces sp. NRRL S-340]